MLFWNDKINRFVYKSHHKNVFDIFKKNNIDLDIYMHTWRTDKNLIWWNAINIPNDYDEYKLLNPTVYRIDEQDDFLKNIDIKNYFNIELFNKYGGDSHHEWYPQLIINHLCALESQKRVTEMCLNSNKKYDYIIYQTGCRN